MASNLRESPTTMAGHHNSQFTPLTTADNTFNSRGYRVVVACKILTAENVTSFDFFLVEMVDAILLIIK